jgi:hypothetical protein
MFTYFVTLAICTLSKLSVHYDQDLPPDKQICRKPEDILKMLDDLEGITRMHDMWKTPSTTNPHVERYLANPDKYTLSDGFDQRQNYTQWVRQMLRIMFDHRNLWRPKSADNPVLPGMETLYEIELAAYKVRAERLRRMHERYVKGTMPACQREVVDILLREHDIDILGLCTAEINKKFSRELNRWRTPEEMEKNEKKRELKKAKYHGV